jgi:hypothetical protein
MRSLAQTKSWRVDKGGFTPSKNELRDYDIHGCADISAHERSNTLLKLTDEHSSVDPNFTDTFTCVYQASETNPDRNRGRSKPREWAGAALLGPPNAPHASRFYH